MTMPLADDHAVEAGSDRGDIRVPAAPEGRDDGDFSTAEAGLRHAGTWVGDDRDQSRAGGTVPAPPSETHADQRQETPMRTEPIVAPTASPPPAVDAVVLGTLPAPVPPDLFSTAEGLRRFVGARAGDDLDQLLDEVYATRSEAVF